MSFRALSKPGSKPPQTLCLNVTLLWWSEDCASELLCSSQNLWACEDQFLSLLLTIFLKRGKTVLSPVLTLCSHLSTLGFQKHIHPEPKPASWMSPSLAAARACGALGSWAQELLRNLTRLGFYILLAFLHSFCPRNQDSTRWTCKNSIRKSD